MPFEEFEHTADVGIHAYGEDLEEAFEEAGKGLFSIMVDLDTVEQKEEHEIELSADDWESLLVNFLSELIYIFEVKDYLFSDFEVHLEENDGRELTAIGKGEELDTDKHTLETAVKAVSYHEINIDTEGDIRIILDI